MTLAISIAAAVTVAVTARLVYLLFLCGKTVSNAGVVGRFVAATGRARYDFAAGWLEQTWRYRLVAYPCILLGIGLVSLLLYSALGLLGKFDSFADILLFCLFVFGFGVALSLIIIFMLMFGVFFLLTLARKEEPPCKTSVNN